MKWCTLFFQPTNSTYAGIFPSNMGKRQIEGVFRQKIKRELNKRCHKDDIPAFLDEIKDGIEIDTMREGRVYEASNFGGFE